jgi:porin
MIAWRLAGQAALLSALCVAPVAARARTNPQAATPQAAAMPAAPTEARPVPPPGPAATGLAPTQAIDAPPVDHLFGDWDGLRAGLGPLGVNLQVDALTEFAGNVSGGTRRGATFANQVGIAADVNWERLAGLTGLSTHVILVNRSGSSDSRVFGDNLLPVQEIYGSGGDVAVHLVSVYAEETLLDKRLDIAAGRMNVENDFASSPLYCNFMNNDLCGDPKALPGGDIGHSAYPDAVWGARVKVRPREDIALTFGAYEVNQGLYTDAYYRSGFRFDSAPDSGVYLPVELAWEPKLGPDALPGHYKLGLGYDTSSGYQDFGNALALAGAPGYARRVRAGNTQEWALADQMVLRNGPGATDGIIALAGFIHNDPNNTAYGEQYFAGLIDRDFWAARPKDTIAMLVTYVEISGRLNAVEAAEQDFGLPLSNKATGLQSHEMVLEANYAIQVLPAVTLMPDFQYVFRPNAQANIQDAPVFGFRAHVQF